MESYIRNISKRQIILATVLLPVFIILLVLSICLEGEAYYYFTRNTPLGTLLYLAAAFRFMEEAKAAMVLDTSYLVVFICLICSVLISLKKNKAIYMVYVVCVSDIFLCLLSKNVFGIVGNILIIISAALACKSRTGDGSKPLKK